MLLIIRFLRCSKAATAIEYCLIAGFISILVVVGLTAIGTKLNSHYFTPISAGLN